MGFFDSLGKGWSFMKAAFAMAGKDRKLLAPSVYQVLLSILYWIGWVAALVAISPHWSNGVWAAVVGVAILGAFIIFYFFCGVTVNMIDVHLRGGRPSMVEGVKDAGKNFVAILFLSIISTIVNMFVSAIRDEDSIVGRIIGGIVEAVWTTMAFLLLPAIIIEDAGFGVAMKRVRALHKGKLLLVGIGEVGVRAVTNLIGTLWFLLTFGAIYGLLQISSGTTAIILAFTVGGTMFALFSAFSTFIRMAYYTCLYLWAVDVEKQGQSAPAPLPLAIALGHSTVGRERAA